MKKSGARGRHKWKWHKKTERAVFSLVGIANTKAWGETLIEATEWHAQSNWISSAVSSNLIWPALWRMTGERNTFPLPAPPSGCAPHTERPTDVLLPHTTTGQHLLCGLWLHTAYTATLLLLSTPPGNPWYIPTTPSVPPSATPDHISAYFTPQPTWTGTSRHSKVMEGDYGGVRG